MRFKILSLIAVVGLVAACGTAPTSETAKTSGEGGAASGTTVVGVIAGTQSDLEVNVGDRVHFAFDKYNLTADARRALQKQAAWLMTNSFVNITIEGHCDERGTREYNLALGQRRASAVADYLVTLGVSADRIVTLSYGKERPQDPASTEVAWAANRRAVTVVR